MNHIFRFDANRGLGQAFDFGIRKAVELGADIVVNTDADNQYQADDIENLIRPIIESKSEIVIGCRPIKNHPEFSPLKKSLQFLGSWIMRKLSGTNIPDAASGFRAFSKHACLRLNIHSKFSHCMETLIQAGAAGITISWVPVNINPAKENPDFFKSISDYIWNSGKLFLVCLCIITQLVYSLFFFNLLILPSTRSRVFIPSIFYTLIQADHIPSLILLSILGGGNPVHCTGLDW